MALDDAAADEIAAQDEKHHYGFKAYGDGGLRRKGRICRGRTGGDSRRRGKDQPPLMAHDHEKRSEAANGVQMDRGPTWLACSPILALCGHCA